MTYNGPALHEFIALDTETTGLDTRRDSLIEVAAVRFVDGEPTDRFESLVRHKGRLPLRVEKLTGITPEDIRTAPPEEGVLRELLSFVGNTPVVGHNVAFDEEVLGRAARKHSLGRLKWTTYDTLMLSSLLLPTLPNHKLATMASALGLPQEETHRAMGDALTCGRAFADLLAGIGRLPEPLRALLNNLLSNDPLGKLFYRPEDEGLRWMPMEELLAQVLRRRAWPQVLTEHPPATVPPLEAVWGEGGLLSETLNDFEDRFEQATMAKKVQDTLQHGGTLVVEAGTGVGKSWAYLFPALRHALENDERIVISTHTRQLQDQLYHKDLPTVLRVLGAQVPTAVIKGKGNYLCTSKLADALKQASAETALPLAMITAWMFKSTDGDLENFLPWAQMNVPNLRDVLGAVALDEHHPCRRFCGAKPACFLSQREERLQKSRILIVNHALLMTLLRGEGAETDLDDAVLIVDEAHHMEDVATDHLGGTLSQGTLGRLASAIDPTQTGGLPARIAAVGGEDITLLMTELTHAHTAVVQGTRRLQNALWNITGQDVGVFQNVKSLWWDLKDPHRNGITEAVLSLMHDVSALHRTLGQWRHTFTEGGENVPEEGPGKTAVAQATLVMHQTESVMDFLEDWHGQTKDDGLVGWVECAQLTQGTTWRLVRSPLQVGELLDRYLARFRAMVFTSATLAVNGHFDFFLERTGLGTVPEHPVQTALIHSPFDYAEHLRLYVPKSPVNRSKGSPSELERQTAAQVTAMCEELGGGMLVLFNSIRELKNVGKAVRPKLEKNRQLLLVQFVDGTRQALSQEFRDDGEAVLFGTRSFFEGLDFKGDALRTLVLAKLPFPYLKEPVIEARMRALAQDGRDPNHSYYHPMAIFLLRQAVGRVIRSHTDRGVVFLLDDRLLTKNYGRRFLDNLPQCPVSTGTLEELLQEAREFLGRETGADVATTPL